MNPTVPNPQRAGWSLIARAFPRALGSAITMLECGVEPFKYGIPMTGAHYNRTLHSSPMGDRQREQSLPDGLYISRIHWKAIAKAHQ
jgi:hypothetical protein